MGVKFWKVFKHIILKEMSLTCRLLITYLCRMIKITHSLKEVFAYPDSVIPTPSLWPEVTCCIRNAGILKVCPSVPAVSNTGTWERVCKSHRHSSLKIKSEILCLHCLRITLHFTWLRISSHSYWGIFMCLCFTFISPQTVVPVGWQIQNN